MDVLLVVDAEGVAAQSGARERLDLGRLRLRRICGPSEVGPLLEQELFDLVLIDLRSVVERPPWLRSLLDRWALWIPIVVLTGVQDLRQQARILQLGVQACLQGPAHNGRQLERDLWEATQRFAFVAALRNATEESENAEEHLAAIIEASNEGTVVTDDKGVVLFVTPATETIMERPSAQLLGWPLPWQLEVGTMQEVELSSPGEPARCLELRAKEISWWGSPAVLTSLRDVTERKRAELVLRQLAQRLDETNRELERQAICDPLTDLLNRRGLAQLLPMMQASSRRAGGLLTAMLVDCDDLKRINDLHGHSVGDLAVKHIGERIMDTIRAEDAAARVGGDEFIVALAASGLPQAALAAERIRLAVASKPLALLPEPLRVTVSIGVAALPPHVGSPEEILPLTRVALQRGKMGGKNRVCVEGPTLENNENPREALLNLVKGPGGLTVASQPIVSLSDERLVGYELLSRGPPGPLRMPDHLFALAKEEGMLTSLDLQCLRTCLAATSSLSTELRAHVNLLPTTLMEVPASNLADIFAAAGGQPLCLEISERQFLGGAASLVDNVARLREQGLCLAIDDVGSTPGTLDNVVLLEPDLVKFDRSMVHGTARDPRKRRVLERMTMLMNALGAEVVAEGVEREEDRDLLRDLGISAGQGYLWGRPELVAGEE